MMGQPIDSKGLGALIQREIELCDNKTGSETQENASSAYNYFLLKKKGDEMPGRSEVQDGTVADVVDATMAAIQPLYSVDELIQIQPEGPDDEERAASETNAVNWYFRERSRGFERLDESIQDAMLVRNGYIKVWPEESYQLPYEQTFSGTRLQVSAQLAQLQQQGRVRVQSETVMQEAVYDIEMVLTEDGLATEPIEQEVSPEMVEVEVLIIPLKQEVKIQTIAREDVGVSRDAVDANLQKPRFVYHRRWMTRNEAIALGFAEEDVKTIPAHDNLNNEIKISRQEGTQKLYESNAANTGGDIINIYECYYLVDADGDGIAERHQVFYGGRKVLRWADDEGNPAEYADDIVKVVPICSGVALRVSHRHLGRSLFDKLSATEDVKRTLKRQMLDNVYEANDQEFIIGPGASEDDFETGTQGGYKRARNPRQDVVPIQHNPIINESLAALQYMDTVRNERGGGSLDTGNAEQPTNINSSVFERYMVSAEQTTAMYARNLANTLIRDVFVLLHMQLKTLGEPLAFKEGEEWRLEQPRFWMDRERFTVKLGKSEGERMRLVAAYDKVIANQKEILQQGGDGVLVDQSGVYEALTDQSRIMGIDNPEQYWIDPQSEQAMQAKQMKAQQAERMAQEQAQQQQALMAAQMQMVTMQETTKRLSDQLDAQQKTLDRINRYVVEMTKIEASTGQDVPGGVLIGDEQMTQ